MSKLRVLLLIVLFGVGGYLWVKGPEGLKLPVVQKVEKPAPISAEQKLQSGGGDETRLNLTSADGNLGGVRVHYFTKEALAACATDTITREIVPDPKYGHAGAGALVAQTLALTGEEAEKYVSALAQGTRLLNMKMSTEGVATADYNAQLNEGLNDCNKTQRRAQIEKTLREFAEIKEVVIMVNGEKWE